VGNNGRWYKGTNGEEHFLVLAGTYRILIEDRVFDASVGTSGFPLFLFIRLPSVNQRPVRSENDRNFSTQRNLLKGKTRTGKKNSNSAKEAVNSTT
jgi:hypothetical protein